MKNVLIRLFTFSFGLLMLTAAFPAESRAQRLTGAQVADSIRTYMEECRTMGLATVLFKGDDILYMNALGWRDKKGGDPLDVNDIFKIASMSKSFSAVSILQLIDEGKLSLEDDVSDLMGFPVRHPKWPDIPITLKMLLSHTSSMKDGSGNSRYWTPDWVNPSVTSVDSMLQHAFYDYAPGQGYNYCNRGFNMLGNIIERASGERFDDYVRRHILDPLGAGKAGYNVDSLDADRLVTMYGYSKSEDKLLRNNAYVRKNEKKVADGTYVLGEDGWGWSPTGGMKITLPDLTRWLMTLRDSCITPSGVRLISPAAYRKLTTHTTPADPGTDYCLGTRTETRLIDGKTLYGHTGSLHGYKGCMFVHPTEGWGFICLCSSTRLTRINEVYEIYYRVGNLLYEQYIKPLQ